MPQQKTYWHLLDRKRMPTEYELLSSRLHYYLTRGFEADIPMRAWFEKYQQGSPLTCSDWEKFCDPRETTYTSYTGLQKTQEAYVDGLLESIDKTGYDPGLSEGWLQILSRGFAPMCYPLHGFQMIAAYFGHLAPGGRITIAGLFQAADEMRRIQRIAYRTRQLQITQASFGQTRKSIWQSDPCWQPLREAVEKLLITYDWGEAFVGLNLVLKPLIDDLFMSHFAGLARHEGDYLLGEILAALEQDCRWQRDWTVAMVRVALEDRPANKAVIEGWVRKWRPLAMRALGAFAPVFDDMPKRTYRPRFEEILAQERGSYTKFLALASLDGSG